METGPRQMVRDPESSKIRKKGIWHRSRGAHLGRPSRWSRSWKNHSQRRAKVVWARVEKRPKGEDERRFNATIVVVTTSCGIARSGKRLKRNLVSLREKTSRPPSPIWTGHQYGTPRSIEDREGGDRETSQQNVDDRGDRKMGIKTGVSLTGTIVAPSWTHWSVVWDWFVQLHSLYDILRGKGAPLNVVAMGPRLDHVARAFSLFCLLIM